MSEESKRKISISTKGIPKSLEMRRKLSDARKGKRMSESTRLKLIQRTPPMLGKKHSLETKLKMKISAIARGTSPKPKKGADCWNWKGGISGEDKLIRNSKEFKELRNRVFSRDNYKCVLCGYPSKGTRPPDIQIDHIKAFATHPEFRLSLENCRTLCVPCHKKTENYGYKTRRL